MSDFHDVGLFHHKFGLDNTTIDSAPGPRDVDPALMAFRIKFLKEEIQEFEDAYAIGDEAGMFDALLDLSYVAYGTAHLKGYPWVQGWNLVQTANMEKKRANANGGNSKRGSSYDVIKPPDWVAPNIEGLLRIYGWFQEEIVRQCPQCHKELKQTDMWRWCKNTNYPDKTFCTMDCLEDYIMDEVDEERDDKSTV